jgi:hypothetical protein
MNKAAPATNQVKVGVTGFGACSPMSRHDSDTNDAN